MSSMDMRCGDISPPLCFSTIIIYSVIIMFIYDYVCLSYILTYVTLHHEMSRNVCQAYFCSSKEFAAGVITA